MNNCGSVPLGLSLDISVITVYWLIGSHGQPSCIIRVTGNVTMNCHDAKLAVISIKPRDFTKSDNIFKAQWIQVPKRTAFYTDEPAYCLLAANTLLHHTTLMNNGALRPTANLLLRTMMNSRATWGITLHPSRFVSKWLWSFLLTLLTQWRIRWFFFNVMTIQFSHFLMQEKVPYYIEKVTPPIS